MAPKRWAALADARYSRCMSQAQWNYFVFEQKALMREALADPQNQRLVAISVLAGVVSSIALAKLYARMTPSSTDDTFRYLLPKAALAVGTGMVCVVWYMNKAYAQRKAFELVTPDVA